MKATIKDFFGSNLEQEVLDEVVILPVAIRTGTGTITLPVNTRWEDFESIEIGLGIGNASVTCFESYVVNKKLIEATPSSWQVMVSYFDGTRYGMSVVATSDHTATWSSIGSSNQWPKYMIGYKRRISRVGIDELMSAMSLPNLIANADLTDNPVNQRGFNGNWSSLAVGAYGYDQWMKVSSTHMGYVVEAGKYRPNAKHTLTKDDVVIGEFVSPSSGHWIVAVPFATSGKFDLYAGQFKRPWHPVLDGLERCLSFFFGGVKYRADSGVTGQLETVMVAYPTTMRKNPTLTRSDASGTLVFNSFQAISKSSVAMAFNGQVGQTQSGTLSGDATITLAEVNGQITTIN